MAARTFEQLMKPYPAPVVELARTARALVLNMMGDKAQESIDTSGPYAFYGYAPGYKGLVPTGSSKVPAKSTSTSRSRRLRICESRGCARS